MRHNKEKCLYCKYHGVINSGAYNVMGGNVACLYNTMCKAEGNLVLMNGKVYDRRGNDPNECKLYEKQGTIDECP